MFLNQLIRCSIFNNSYLMFKLTIDNGLFSDIFLHERFFAGSLHNDLALLRLAEDVAWGHVPHVAPACLPRAHATFTGSRCWVTGWGQVGTRGYTKAGKEISRKCLQGLRIKHCEVSLTPL